MLNAKREAFCRAYAENPNGAEAAPAYAPAELRQACAPEPRRRREASRLLAKPEIAERLEELHLQAAERRARATDELMAKLDPVYSAVLKGDDHDRVMEVVRLQAQIAGLIGARRTP